MSDIFLIKQIGFGVLLPAIISGLVLLLGRRFLGSWISALGISAGYVMAHYLLYNMKAFSLTLALQDWLPYIAIVALAWVLLEQLWWRFLWVRWLMRLFIIETIATRLLWTKITHRLERFRWEWYETAVYLTAIAVLVLAVWYVLERVSLRDAEGEEARTRAILPSALILFFALFSGSTLFSHAGIGAQTAGILTATLGAIMVLCWFNPVFHLAVPAVGVVSIMLLGFGINAYFFSDMPWYTVLLFAAAPATLLLPLPKMPLIPQTAVRLGLMAVPTLLATALTFFLVY